MMLTDFLLDRIAEDEDLLRQALDCGVARADGTLIWAPEVMKTFTPRLLAECEAKRGLIANMQTLQQMASVSPSSPGLGASVAHVAHLSLTLLALPYVGHRDYREEWKP